MRDGDEPSDARVPLETGGCRPPARLRRRAEFLAVAAGRRFHTDRLTVQGLRRDSAPESGRPAGDNPVLRVGFTVTKRVGHATERNRIRRRLRAAADRATADFAGPPLDVVVVGRRDALATPFATLVGDIARALPVVAKPHQAKTPSNKSPSDKPKPAAAPHHGRGRGPVPVSRTTHTAPRRP